MAYTPNAIRLHLCTGKFYCKLFLLVFVSCIFVFEKFLAVRFSYESTNTLSVFIFLLTLEWISFHHVENLISCKINVSFCSNWNSKYFFYYFYLTMMVEYFLSRVASLPCTSLLTMETQMLDPFLFREEQTSTSKQR